MNRPHYGTPPRTYAFDPISHEPILEDVAAIDVTEALHLLAKVRRLASGSFSDRQEAIEALCDLDGWTDIIREEIADTIRDLEEETV